MVEFDRHLILSHQRSQVGKYDQLNLDPQSPFQLTR